MNGLRIKEMFAFIGHQTFYLMFLLTITFSVHVIDFFSLHVLFALRPRITQREKRNTWFCSDLRCSYETIIALVYEIAVVI